MNRIYQLGYVCIKQRLWEESSSPFACKKHSLDLLP